MAISQDETLKGNEKNRRSNSGITKKETSQEMLAHALTVIRRRMNENGQVIVAVEMNPGNTQMAVKSVQTEDGKCWWYAFTSFDER
ncbi:MAG: SseB family protein [Coprococcus phoceensis]